ncbi:MAG: hypothetical protein F6K00_06235 [Leptolyngbya sp. SIOISBB]|nr:hypothetical protein [Leptolyngbya sp. SIOISBB]
MGKIDTLHKDQQHLQAEPKDLLQVLTLVPQSFIDLAQEYGFERHQRIYACPVNFVDNARPCPSFLEAWLGDG